MTNIDGLCNSSPSFSTDPTATACVNQPFVYTHAANDADGDSLEYAMITPRSNISTNIIFNNPLNGQSPLATTVGNPLQLNDQSGVTTFVPSTAAVAVMSVRVLEYRNGGLIGYTTRDLQVTVFSGCTNDAPNLNSSSISNVVNGTHDNGVVTTCKGSILDFDISVSDVNSGDNLTITESITNQLPGATVTQTGSGSNISLNVSWPVPTTAKSFYSISLIAEDDACPVKGTSGISYTINVLDKPNVSVTSDTTFCQGATFNQSIETAITGGIPGTYS
jgi:hypothetical protein